MNTKDYQVLAHKTEPSEDQYWNSVVRLTDAKRILHGAMGLCTESGELIDNLKKHIYYNKPLDTTNLKEEIGDILWYVTLLCSTLGYSMEEIMNTNIAKLKLRYRDKFTEDSANNRNLEKERNLLEKMSQTFMDKWHSYLIIELPNHTEEEINKFKTSIESCIGDYHYEPDKPIIVKKISYTTNQEKK